MKDHLHRPFARQVLAFMDWVGNRSQGAASAGSSALGLAMMALTIARLTLTRGQTMMALGTATHDDGLFVRLARAVLAGDWLGPYDQLTLVKGPFYPAWIAGIHALGLPLLLSQQALYVFACAAFALALKPLLPRATVFVMYCVLLFNPASYADQVSNRVAREAVYPALTMLVVACAAGLLARREGSLASLARWSVGLGLALAAFWLTREEGPWLVPPVLVLLGVCALGAWSARPSDFRSRVSLCVLPLAIGLLSIAAVSAVNYFRYGVFATVELKSPDFLAAYGSLARVEHPAADPRVPVPREARERVYAVSPAFAELRPLLEGDLGRAWTAVSCWATSICSDIGGGWFLWALRDAAAATGHHRSGRAAASYYRTLANQVNAACAQGALPCGPGRHTLMPPWRSGYIWPFLRTVARTTLALPRFEDCDPVPSPSVGPEDSLRPFREVANGRLTPRYLIRGWAVSPSGPTYLSVRRTDGQRTLFLVTRLSSPDIDRLFHSAGLTLPEAASARFEITTACTHRCELLVTSTDGLLGRIPLEDGAQSLGSPALYLDVESSGYEAPPFTSRADAMMLALLRTIGSVYRALVPFLLLAALGAFGSRTLRAWRSRALTPTWWIASALLLAIATRLLLLSLIHVTSFPAVGIGRLAPAHPLLLVFAVMGLPVGRPWRGRSHRAA